MPNNNLSNWSLKFSKIIWAVKNSNTKPTNFMCHLSLNEKDYLKKEIDDFFIPFTKNGGKTFKMALKEIVQYHKASLIERYGSDIRYFKIELFFKNTELIVDINGDLIRKKKFFDIP